MSQRSKSRAVEHNLNQSRFSISNHQLNQAVRRCRSISTLESPVLVRSRGWKRQSKLSSLDDPEAVLLFLLTSPKNANHCLLVFSISAQCSPASNVANERMMDDVQRCVRHTNQRRALSHSQLSFKMSDSNPNFKRTGQERRADVTDTCLSSSQRQWWGKSKDAAAAARMMRVSRARGTDL